MNLIQKNKTQHPFKRKPLEEDIEQWNLRFPFDYQWRLKYKVAFGSPQHRAMDFFDMRFDILEERYIQALQLSIKDSSESQKQLLKHQRVHDQISDDEFENLDISSFNDKTVK
jgi:hypothetical protein